MTNNMKRHLLTLYTRTPLHVGSGTSVDVVDLPIMRERITGFPVIPSTSLKGVLLQAAREKWGNPKDKLPPPEARLLFGTTEEPELDAEGQPLKDADGKPKKFSHAGCVQIMEAKILAFPVRSLAGCFAWLTCPAALRRFQRDTGLPMTIPAKLEPEHVIAGSDLLVAGRNEVVLEDHALSVQPGAALNPASETAKGLHGLTADLLWQEELGNRLAIVHDENFQHFVTSCTEVVARIAIDPGTRTNAGGALFNQENIPCEALFYTVLHVLPARKPGANGDLGQHLTNLLAGAKVIQIGGDETTGHGLCETKHQPLDDTKEAE
jgi:CRISPR-associated protein Cmr4